MVSVAIPAYATKKTKDVSGEFLKEKMGYDFINLVTKLAIFYTISFLISKYMEAVIYFQGGLSTVAGFFGIKMAQADQLPRQWVELFIDVNQKTVSSTPTAPGQFNPEGWDKPYDYGTPEHQEAEPYLFPQKEQKYKFWDLINAIAVLYIGWEAYKYYKNAQLSDKGVDYLTMAIFSLLSLAIGVLSFSKFLGRFSFNKFQEENR
jgi:hypothetical protein